jgi:hypothetical protein
MNIPYSPQTTPGSAPLAGGVRLPSISLYSPKSIVASSQPVRSQVAETQILANELEQDMQSWISEDRGNPFNKFLNN